MGKRWTIAKVLPALGFAACGKILGADLYEVDRTHPVDAGHHDAASDGSSGAAFQFANAKCEACVKQSCSKELQNCQVDIVCAGWERCMTLCEPDAPNHGACERDCFVNAPATNDFTGEIAACTFEHCYDDCKAGGYWPAQGAGCSAAVRDGCEASNRACSGDKPCLDLTRCLFAENCLVATSGAAASGGLNPGCLFTCLDPTQTLIPMGIGDGGVVPTVTSAQAACIVTHPLVYQECRGGEAECARHYDWPGAAGPTIQVQFQVTNAIAAELAGTVLEGVRISACGLSSSGCGDLHGSDFTDANGRVTLRNLPTDSIGKYWYFELLREGATGVQKALYHRGRRFGSDTTVSMATGSLEEGALARFAELSEPWSPELGVIMVNMRACNMRYLYRATVLLDGVEHPTIVYFDTSFNLGKIPTSSTGAAYLAGVTEGRHELSAVRDGEEISRSWVVVERNALSFVDLLPKTAEFSDAGPGP